MTTLSLSRVLARYALGLADADLPPRARAMAVDAIVDCVGCMLAGSREPIGGSVARTLALAPPREGGVPLAGTRALAAPADAALYLGAVAHALDYDDTNHPAYAHPSAVIVATALALAPLAGARGRDVVTAHALGVEVFGKLGRALNNDHYLRGWHATATFGTLAAVAVAGRMLRLDEDAFVHAIGIAASSAGGLRANFGSMVKPLHAGYAARNGVLAALLAREGLTASEASLDHRYGYASVFNDGLARDLGWLEHWGEPLEILTDFGLALKPYPSCGATHTGIEAAIALHREIAGRPIAAVRAEVSELAFAPLIHVQAAGPLEGKFSLHFCLAAALLDGRVDLATFSEARVSDPAVRALIDRTTMEAVPRYAQDSEFPTTVIVALADDTRLEKTVPLAQGKPARWPDAATMAAKFAGCAAGVLDPARRDAAYARLAALDDDRPLDDLYPLLAADPAAAAADPAAPAAATASPAPRTAREAHR